jgi:hypothetical protein
VARSICGSSVPIASQKIQHGGRLRQVDRVNVENAQGSADAAPARGRQPGAESAAGSLATRAVSAVTSL